LGVPMEIALGRNNLGQKLSFRSLTGAVALTLVNALCGGRGNRRYIAWIFRVA
jgi:hypothetical protein